MRKNSHCSFDINLLDRLLNVLVCGEKVYVIVQEDITNVYHVDVEKRSCQKLDVMLPNGDIFSSFIPAYFLQ